MDAPSIEQIPLVVRLAMARAATQVVADGIGVRMLHIKGDSVDPSLRPMSSSGTDVDVLIDPAAAPAMHAALLRENWIVYSTYAAGSPFGHAQTYFHDNWGHLDLHRAFPGIQLDRAAAFERLWAQRIGGVAAGIPYAAPSVDAQAVLLMLNAARAGEAGRWIADALWDAADLPQRARILTLVEELDSAVAFAAATGHLDAYSRRREYLLWKTISQNGSRVEEWWGRIRAERTVRGAVAVVLRAPLANREQLQHRLGRPPTAKDIVVEFGARLGRGMQETAGLVLRRRR